jgi:hypothetical protein
MEAEAEARRAMLQRTRDVVFAFFSGQMLLKDFLLEVGVVDSRRLEIGYRTRSRQARDDRSCG